MFDSSFERALTFGFWLLVVVIWLFGGFVGLALGWFVWGRS